MRTASKRLAKRLLIPIYGILQYRDSGVRTWGILSDIPAWTASVNAQGILVAWENRYGQLSAPHRELFLQRAEIAYLEKLPDDAVRRAIGCAKRLSAILMQARANAEQVESQRVVYE
jgi:hypothetical protein